MDIWVRNVFWRGLLIGWWTSLRHWTKVDVIDAKTDEVYFIWDRGLPEAKPFQTLKNSYKSYKTLQEGGQLPKKKDFMLIPVESPLQDNNLWIGSYNIVNLETAEIIGNINNRCDLCEVLDEYPCGDSKLSRDCPYLRSK